MADGEPGDGHEADGGAVREGRRSGAQPSAPPAASGSVDDGPTTSAVPPEEREFDRRDWLLVAAVFVAFVVVPVLIHVRPPGVSFTVAYLVLPLVPAVLLALLAVWVTTRP